MTATAEVKDVVRPDSSALDTDSDVAWKVDLLRSVGEECQTEAELKKLVEKKPNFVLYDGFEPSGRMHIAQGVYKTINVNKCTKAGGTFIFWVADWFALMNDKMGGDINKIRTVGEYLIEVWKASGMDMTKVKFLWSSEEISKHAEEYWGHALDIAQRSTLARVKKCCQIMGRKEDSLTAAQILYPIMQCADIFFLRADICQLGVDQRKVNMLARDYCDAAGRKLKPVILSHHMLYGLKKGQAKMSKSDPDSAIFMEDAPEDVQRKLSNAYCPVEADVAELAADDSNEMQLVKDELKNPCLDYAQYVVFSREGATMEISGKTYSDFAELKNAFLSGDVKEEELKACLAAEVNDILEPVRRHFTEDEVAKALLEQVKQWKRESLEPTSSITRMQLSPEDGETAVGRSYVVFAPLASETVLLSSVWDVAARLRQAPSDFVPLLWLRDWSARTLGCVGGAEERIHGYYNLLLHGLRSLAPDLMERVRVVWQGQAILSDPEPYWTSVINAGRQCSLETVRRSLPKDEDLEGAAQVVASIMHVGDVLALAHKDGTLIICDEHGQDGLHQLAAEHLVRCGLPKPMIQTTEVVSLRLQAEGEGLEADTNVSLTDAVPDVSRKIKKAFCEPENVDFCPPLVWVDDFLLPLQSEFMVKRKPENGGDKVYTSADELRADFAAGALHPGDLKPALGKALNAALDGVRAGVKGSKELKRAQKKLDDFIKAQRKKQKK